MCALPPIVRSRQISALQAAQIEAKDKQIADFESKTETVQSQIANLQQQLQTLFSLYQAA